MNQRTDGWYWVKLEDSDGWIPWEWRSSSRSPQGVWFNNEEPLEIGQRAPTPDEPWQCVPTEMTLQMREAFDRADQIFCQGVGEKPDTHWRFILAAAPTPGESRHEDAEG